MVDVRLVREKRIAVSLDAVEINTHDIKTGDEKRCESYYSGIGSICMRFNLTNTNTHHA